MPEPREILEKKKRPLRIAVVGIDGTGKSTAGNTIEKVLSKKYTVSHIRPLPTQENNHRITRKLKKLQDKGHKENRPDIIFLTQLLHAPSMPFTRIKREKKSDVIIHDRHMLIDGEVYAKEYVPGRLKSAKYLTGTPKPDIIVHLRCDCERAYKRIIERQLNKDPKKKVLHIHETPEKIKEASKKFDEVMSKIEKKHPEIKILRIDSDQPKKKMLEELEQKIKDITIQQ